MIDINTVIQQALEKAITDAVNEKFDDLACRIEGVNGRLNNHVNASVQSAPNLGQMRAQFAEDIATLRETLSGMQERFALKEIVDDEMDVLKRAVTDSEKDIRDIHGVLRTLKNHEPELDSDEIASVIADLFSDGTLTITIDKV